MNEFAIVEQTPSVEELLPWYAETDSGTGAFAFVNDRARLRVLLLPPDISGMFGKSVEGRWGARLIHECPYSTMQPFFLAVEDSEIEVVEKAEDWLLDITSKDQAFLEGVKALEKAGLEVPSVADVVAAFVGSDLDIVGRVHFFLKGIGPFDSPTAKPDVIQSGKIQSALTQLGFSKEEAANQVLMMKQLAEFELDIAAT